MKYLTWQISSKIYVLLPIKLYRIIPVPLEMRKFSNYISFMRVNSRRWIGEPIRKLLCDLVDMPRDIISFLWWILHDHVLLCWTVMNDWKYEICPIKSINYNKIKVTLVLKIEFPLSEKQTLDDHLPEAHFYLTLNFLASAIFVEFVEFYWIWAWTKPLNLVHSEIHFRFDHPI